jgi:hypothetical protein
MSKIDREAVRVLLEQKVPGVQIAKRLRCSANVISAIKRELGFAIEPRKPAAEWNAPIRARKRAVRKFAKPSAATKYNTEKQHLALQIAEWPDGIHFEDARVPAEPLFRGTPPAFGFSLIGNGTAMSAAKGGFV